MKQVLVVFENNYQLSRLFKKFVGKISNTDDVKVYEMQRVIETKDTSYKLIGAGFPYVDYEDLYPKLNGYRFDDVMIHSEVVLSYLDTLLEATKHGILEGVNSRWQVDSYIKSRMLDSDQPFTEFEL